MLVDTSVWIEHFRRSHRPLVGALERGDVQCHDYVVGELACGTLPRRDEVLAFLHALPWVGTVSHAEAMVMVDQRRLWGHGLGWIDISLLAAALIGGTRLWTVDRRLRRVAHELDVNWEPI